MKTVYVLRRACMYSTVADNCIHLSTGAINIGSCRVPFTSEEDERESKDKNQHEDFGTGPLTGNIVYGDYSMVTPTNYNPPGRWPANLLLMSIRRGDEWRFFKHVESVMGLREYLKNLVTVNGGLFVEADASYDWSAHEDASVHGVLMSDDSMHSLNEAIRVLKPGGHLLLMNEGTGHVGACRAEDIGFEVRDCIYLADSPDDKLHFVPKAAKKEREKGLEDFDEKVFGMSSGAQGAMADGDDYEEAQSIGLNRVTKRKNTHPTVKPVKVMERLLADVPEGSLVVDPFVGSGTTGVAVADKYNFVGVEKEEEYVAIARNRIEACSRKSGDGIE